MEGLETSATKGNHRQLSNAGGRETGDFGNTGQQQATKQRRWETGGFGNSAQQQATAGNRATQVEGLETSATKGN